MKKNLVCLLGLVSAFALSGCVVRSYPVTKDRVDQDLGGNRGFLMGRGTEETKERRPTRTTRVVEIEMYPPVKFAGAPKEKAQETAPAPQIEDRDLWGNQGYVVSPAPSIETSGPEIEPVSGSMEKYTVQKGDTLQKISQKFYGTTKKWHRVFKANEAVLKAPDRIYPGQVIDIPVDSSGKTAEPLPQIQENLK
jgi:hypothetical protein